MMILAMNPAFKSLLEAMAQGPCTDPNCEACAQSAKTATGTPKDYNVKVGPETAGTAEESHRAPIGRANESADALAFALEAKAISAAHDEANRIARQRVHGDLIGYIRTQLRSLQLHQIEVEHDNIKTTERPDVIQARIEYLRHVKALFEAKASLV